MPDFAFSLVFLKYASAATLGAAIGSLAYIFIRIFRETSDTYAQQMSNDTVRQFEDMFMFIPPQRIAELGRAGAITFFLLFFIPLFRPTNLLSTGAGLVLGALAAFMALNAPKHILKILRNRRRDKFNLQLVEALGSMGNALRAGYSINQAFETIVKDGENPIAQEFSVMLQQMRVGMNFYDALKSLEMRVESDDLTLVVTSIDIARRTGGNLTEIFDRISMTIRERMRITRRVKTLTAQGRMQGIIVAAMPVLLGGAMTAIKPSLMIPFFASVNGVISVIICIVLITIGWLIIRKIITIDV